MIPLVRRAVPTGLRARLLLLVAFAMAPALVLIVVLNVEDRHEQTAKAYEDAARIVRLAVAEQARHVDEAFHTLMEASRVGDIWNPDQERCSAALRSLYARHHGYSNLGIVSTDGRLRCSALPSAGTVSYAERPWFQRAVTSQQRVVTTVERGHFSGGRPVIAIALPLVDEVGVHAVAYAGLRLDWLADFAAAAQLGRDATFEILDSGGTILARAPEPQGWIHRAGLDMPHIRAVVTRRQGTIQATALDRLTRLYAFAPLVADPHAPQVYVAIGIPVRQAFAKADTALARNIVWLALAAALTFAAAWSGGSRLVLGAVRSLVAAAERLGRGDLTTRVALGEGHGELSQLARAFDDMAGGLERREAALAAAAAARRDAEARLQWATIAETSHDAIIGMDRDGIAFSWNSGAEALFGHAAADAVGRSATMVIAPDCQPDAVAQFNQALGGARVNDVVLAAVTRDGRRIETSWTLSPIHDPAGAMVGVSAIARDITERRAAEMQMRVRSAALEAAANGIVITDAHGRIEWANAAFAAMSGYAVDEAIGQTSRILKSGRHDDAFYADLWRTVAGGHVWQGRLVNRRKDGTVYDEEETITPVRGADGAIEHYVAIKQDVTAQRLAETALRRSEEHFRSLIENALDMIFVLDRDGVIRYASPSVDRVLGYRPEQCVGRSCFDPMHPDDVPAVRAVLAGLEPEDAVGPPVQYRVARREGGWRSLEAIGRVVTDETGGYQVVVNARDITERMEADEARQRLQAQLGQAEKLAAMGNLLAGVAHELNNPLAVVIGHATLMATTSRGTAAETRAIKIQDAAQRCARIVKNFLALARQHEPERSRTDLRQLVRDTLEMMAYPLRVDAVEVALDLADDVPMVAVDPHQIQQVIVNLVTNAHHAMREVSGARRLTVSLRFAPEARAVALALADTGPGIPHTVRARLFEPFFTTKPVGQGTGLGLSICKGIVEGHGGQIELDTTVGRGTTFTVLLPSDAAVAAAPPVEDVTPPEAPARVLVVDDEPDVVTLLEDILSASGHRVDSARTGQEALAKLGGGTYDAVLSDVKMPGLDGRAFYRAVLEERPDLASRFVFVTGDTLNPATATFLEEANVPNLAKPFSPDAVRRALAAVLAGAQREAATMPAASA